MNRHTERLLDRAYDVMVVVVGLVLGLLVAAMLSGCDARDVSAETYPSLHSSSQTEATH